MKLSIVIPVYNEGRTIRRVLERIHLTTLPISKEIIVSDDGSSDETSQILQEYRDSDCIKVHTSLINLGKGAALRFGFEYVTGDIVLIQDGDLEQDPADYPKLIEPILKGEANVVYGSRFLNPAHKVSFVAYIANWLLTTLTNVLYGSRLTDMETAFKVFRTTFLRQMRLRAVGFEIEPELTAKTLRLGERITEIPVKYNPRTRREGKKINWRDGVKAVYYLLKYRMIPKREILSRR